MPRSSSSKANRNDLVSKSNKLQENNMKSTERNAAARNSPERVFVNSLIIQEALETFINRHRSSLQKLTELNSKLGQQNSLLNVQINNQHGTILALNEKIAAGEKELTKYKEEQTRLMESKSLLRAELLTFKKRCGELMISNENELKECGEKEAVLRNEVGIFNEGMYGYKRITVSLNLQLDVIRQELQAKHAELDNNNSELVKTRIEINESKLQLEQQQKSINDLQDELLQKDKTINTLRKEHVDYKTETEKTINKMREIQQIFYPNATNPLPHIQRNDETRSTQPVSITVQPRPQSRAALKRSSTSSSSDTDVDNEERALLRGWRPTRNVKSLPTRSESGRGSTDIPPTSESGVEVITHKRSRR
ncbi:EH domain-containing and endocytosis protein 1-like isoform X1 [Bactrocera tryoni]|uniref:EH domain-containing and endocytosis protein 1-like isoform X1 n=1 Tax=Bactrocera tryoni TaxID=59916 RepID=UPI001A9578FF|nr:EH domain-containing and endocytosis protein 1-like isoform X1 [Bactrocera tryoni]